MPVWLNADGLFIKTGRDEAGSLRGGQISNFGPHEVIEFDLNLTELTNTATVLMDTVRLPRGARLERIEVVNEVAATSGGAATFNLGVINEDRTTGGVATGLVNALALASLNAPAGRVTSINVGSAGAGATLGTSLANQVLVTGSWGTAAYTAGRVVVRLYFYTP